MSEPEAAIQLVCIIDHLLRATKGMVLLLKGTGGKADGEIDKREKPQEDSLDQNQSDAIESKRWHRTEACVFECRIIRSC